MCKYCEGGYEDIYKHFTDNGQKEDLYVYLDENQIVYEIYADLDMYSGVLKAKIKYCPKCGRRLKDDKC